MKKCVPIIFIICFMVALFIIIPRINAQESVAPNGKFATVKGRKIYYEDTGKGVPLLLLHGFFGTCSQWKGFVPEFSKAYRVIAIDLPGHGRSDYMDTTDVYSHKMATEYLIAFLDVLHIDSVYVMGTSTGGVLCLYMATLKPELTKKIIVIAGQLYFSSSTRNIKFFDGSGNPRPEKVKFFNSNSRKSKRNVTSPSILEFQKTLWRSSLHS